MSIEQEGFKDPTQLTKWTKRFLYAQLVMGAIAIVSNILEYRLFSDFENGVYASKELAVAAAETSDTRQGIVGIFQVIVYLASAIFILKWIHRANYNAHQLGAKNMAFTPGWSIGWYFIPIANLWKPYQAMKEIWKASSNPNSWESQSVPSLLSWWWFFWILYGALGNASFRLTVRAEEIDQLMTANVVTQLSDIAGFPLNLLLIAIVSKVYAMQMAQAAAGQGTSKSL